MHRIEVQAVQFQSFGSHGVTINHPVAPEGDQAAPAILRSGGPAHVVTVLLEPGGKIGRHPATGHQLLMLITGELQVSGNDGQLMELTAGQAVLFEPGEQHESVADTAVSLTIMEYDSSAV